MGNAYRPRLVIFVKAPELGRVKTRLAKDIGVVEATKWYRRNCAKVICDLSADAHWQTVLCVSPDSMAFEQSFQEVWPKGVLRIPQGQGDLGERMGRVFQRMPPGPVMIVGGDIPGITRTHIANGFATLGAHDAVFGPAADGGYWLVGQKRIAAMPDMFSHVRWSTEHALQDTLANCKGCSVAMLDELSDVDVVKDL